MNAILFGEHPILPHLIGQYKQLGAVVTVSAMFDVSVLDSSAADQIVILSSKDAQRSDSAALDFLTRLSLLHHRRIPVLLLLQSRNVLHCLRMTGLPDSVDAAFEVWPFTMEEIWARNLFLRMPGIQTFSAPPVDRSPITKDSGSFVHLVIAGTNSYAREVAVQAAMLCHFPNFNAKDRRPLRTRISFISPGIMAFRDSFIGQYPQLFTHSYYRTVNLEEKTTLLHRPKYEGKRSDFVDTEWEFVDTSLSHPQMAHRLSGWAQDEIRQPTLVLCEDDPAAAICTCQSLPEAVFERKIPVWILQITTSWTGLLDSSRYDAVYPFGMEDCGLDVTMPQVEMARLLHYCYTYRYQNGALPTSLPAAAVEEAWSNAGSLNMRLSNLYNVMTMASKMRSLGHKGEDLRNFFALSPEEVEDLARTEHNRWCVERLLSGSRPCNDQELEEIQADPSLKRKYKAERNAHPDLCAYDELLPDESGTDVREYDRALTACIPLIVQTFVSAKQHE